MNSAKFLPPRPARVLERERLMNKLLGWEDKKLVIIHAQAGQGKSTLAAQYAQALGSTFVWYNVDRDDDNPELFLSSLADAIQRAWPQCASKLPPIPQNRYGIGNINQGLDRWFSQVFAALPLSSLIVFDDYYNAPASSALHDLLTAMVANPSPHARFLVISRTRPELGIARLRATRSVGELTGEELRFTDPEVQELFSIVFRMQISQNEAALINGAAEGWPAGLVLMHEYLSALPPKERVVALTDRRASGFRTHVFDYLAQEVFANLLPDMQRFLLRTSIVDYLSLPLMELLAGLPRTASRKTPAASMVKELRARNLFVHAMDDDASVIRYHALFRDFLRKKLMSQTRPSELKSLYTVAANHFFQAGDRVRGVDLLLASGQFDHAVKQIESCGTELIAHGRTRTLIRWIEALPLEYGNRPWFLFYRAVDCRFTDPRTALTFFELAFKGFRAHPAALHRTPGLMLSLCGIIEACFYADGNFKRMSRAAATAGALLRSVKRQSNETHARLLLAMGTAFFFIGKLREGAEALREALEAFRASRDYYHQIQSAIYLAPCSIYLGDFVLAREAVRKGFEAHGSIPDESGGRAALLMAQAMTMLFEGRFAEARESIDQCHALAQEYELEAFNFLSLDIGGWLRIAIGDYTNAEALLRQCKSKGEELKNEFFSASAAHLLAVSYLHRNKLNQAQVEADYALSIRARSGSRLFYAVSLSASGALALKQGSLAKAERALTSSLALFRRIGAAQQEANVLLLLARLNKARKQDHEAKRLLHAGFRIGEELGFTYYYLHTHAELLELARLAVAAGICEDYCGALLSGEQGGVVAPSIKVHCLGGFRLFRGKEEVKDTQWKSPRAKALFKLLATQDNLVLSRDAAVDALWCDALPEAPRHAFNSLLSRIRKVLEPSSAAGASGSCIIQKDDTVLLDSKRVWTDVSQFLAHMEKAERLKSGARAAQALEEYAKAFALYQGDFLPEDLSLEWTTQMRDRLRIRYLRGLEDSAAIAESTGDWDCALSLQEKMFLVDPCHEKACRWLMTRYLSDGRRNEAIRAYERCERALSRDLDLEPDETTKMVYRGIIGG